MAIFKTARKQFTLRKYHQFISFFTTRSSLYAEMFLKDSQENHPKRRKVENDLKNAKPFSEIPYNEINKEVKINPVLRALHKLLKYKNTTVRKQPESSKTYSEIILEKNNIAKTNYIHTSDVESIERLYQFEGNFPIRLIGASWKQRREKTGHELGVLLSHGEHWKQMRSLLEKRIMDPKAASMYIEDINDVVSSFIDRIRQTSESIYNNDLFYNTIFNWSLETMGCILYETRFGALSDNKSQEMSLFINAVHKLFLSNDKIFIDADADTGWHEMHANAWDIIYNTTTKHVDNKSKEIDCKLKNGDNISGFLSTLIASLQMSEEEISANIIELILGAVLMTPHSMMLCLHQIAIIPDIQEDLAHEQFTVLGGKGIPTYEDLKEMPILMSVIKETLRMYPSGLNNGRELTQDMNICGYCVPKGSTVVMHTDVTARDHKYYPYPNHFMPNRWLRQGGDTANEAHPFSYLPFGYGARKCIGKSIGQLKLLLLLARVVQEFRIEALNDAVKFIDR